MQGLGMDMYTEALLHAGIDTMERLIASVSSPDDITADIPRFAKKKIAAYCNNARTYAKARRLVRCHDQCILHQYGQRARPCSPQIDGRESAVPLRPPDFDEVAMHEALDPIGLGPCLKEESIRERSSPARPPEMDGARQQGLERAIHRQRKALSLWGPFRSAWDTHGAAIRAGSVATGGGALAAASGSCTTQGPAIRGQRPESQPREEKGVSEGGGAAREDRCAPARPSPDAERGSPDAERGSPDAERGTATPLSTSLRDTLRALGVDAWAAAITRGGVRTRADLAAAAEGGELPAGARAARRLSLLGWIGALGTFGAPRTGSDEPLVRAPEMPPAAARKFSSTDDAVPGGDAQRPPASAACGAAREHDAGVTESLRDVLYELGVEGCAGRGGERRALSRAGVRTTADAARAAAASALPNDVPPVARRKIAEYSSEFPIPPLGARHHEGYGGSGGSADDIEGWLCRIGLEGCAGPLQRAGVAAVGDLPEELSLFARKKLLSHIAAGGIADAAEACTNAASMDGQRKLLELGPTRARGTGSPPSPERPSTSADDDEQRMMGGSWVGVELKRTPGEAWLPWGLRLKRGAVFAKANAVHALNVAPTSIIDEAPPPSPAGGGGDLMDINAAYAQDVRGWGPAQRGRFQSVLGLVSMVHGALTGRAVAALGAS
eukprot:gene26406-45779_t